MASAMAGILRNTIYRKLHGAIGVLMACHAYGRVDGVMTEATV
jgi:hypothetical protein